MQNPSCHDLQTMELNVYHILLLRQINLGYLIPDLLADGSILLVVRELAVVGPARAANGRPGADCTADLSIHSYFPRSATKLYYS